MIPISSTRPRRGFTLTLTAALFCLRLAASAQTNAPPQLPLTRPAPAFQTASLLPDAPAMPARIPDVGPAAVVPMAEATRYQKFIEAGQPVSALTAHDKIVLGLRNAVSPLGITGWFTSSGDEQVFNTAPNYGTDRGAFGQRLGAAALCNASEGIFTDSVLAPLLREDPRYYRLGDGHHFFARLFYAGTRPLLTRTDSGRTTPNFALVAGNLAGSALTNVYYPQVNRGPNQTMQTLGLSIGGSAVGDVVGEFYGDVAHLFHRNSAAH